MLQYSVSHYICFAVKPYQPCDLVTLRQLYKLETGTSHIKVLSQLIPHVEAFKNKAGFGLNENIYCYYWCEHPVAAYISSWESEKNPKLKPTWKNFLYVLGELGLKELAMDIEHFLLASKSLVIPDDGEESRESMPVTCEFLLFIR